MSTTPENETVRPDERSRCWATNVDDESENQPSEGGFLAGITVTTEISISNHDDTVTTTTIDGSDDGDEAKADNS